MRDNLNQKHPKDIIKKDFGFEDIEELDKALQSYPSSIGISCKNNEGIDTLRQQIANCYEKKLSPHQLSIQHSQAGLISKIRKFALIVNEAYEEDRICLSLRLPPGGKTKLENLFSSR